MSFWAPTIHTFENKEQVSDLAGSVNTQKNQEILSTIIDKRTIDEINYNAQFWDSLFNNLSQYSSKNNESEDLEINIHMRYLHKSPLIISTYPNITKLYLLWVLSHRSSRNLLKDASNEELKWRVLDSIRYNWPTYIQDQRIINNTANEIFEYFANIPDLSNTEHRYRQREHGIKNTNQQQISWRYKRINYAWTTKEWYLERAKVVDEKLKTWWTLEGNMQNLINKYSNRSI